LGYRLIVETLFPGAYLEDTKIRMHVVVIQQNKDRRVGHYTAFLYANKVYGQNLIK
jgi:hypothetical protein